MAEPRNGVHGRLLARHRLVFGALVICALVTGYWGFAIFLRGNTQFGHNPLDLLYDDLQLFVLGPFPLQQGGSNFPVLLQVGRLIAPLVTVFAFIEAGRVFLAGELVRWRTQRMHGHTVVCGSGALATLLAGRLAAAGRTVVTVRPSPIEGGRPEPGQVFGDPRLPEVLRAAAVQRATVLFACTDDTATNAEIALNAAGLARSGDAGLTVHTQVSDPDLCLALQARHLGRPSSSRARFQFFNLDEVAARALLFADRLPNGVANTVGRPPRILVVGASTFGRAVVVELARCWRAGQPATAALPTVLLADERASAAVDEIICRYPFVPRACELVPFDGALTDQLVKTSDERPTAVFVCLPDEEACLRTALAVESLWHAGADSVTVQHGALASLRRAFDGAAGDPLLDATTGVLRLFDVLDAACDPELLAEDLIERMARVVHERYRMACLARGERPAGNPSLIDWSELPAELRRSCRNQAEDISEKLHRIGCLLAPRVTPGAQSDLSEDTVDQLAQMEQHRWVTERIAAGWTRGPKDYTAHRHPDLVPWETLSVESQTKNRDAMRELTDIVADAGFHVVRL